MQILFIISIVCLLALIGAAAAIIHHVRAGHRNRLPEAPPEPTFAEHLEAAAEHGSSPRPLRLIPRQSVQSISAKKDWTPSTPSSSSDTASSSGPDNSGIVQRTIGSFASEDRFRFSQTHLFHVPAGTRTVSFRHF